MSLPKQFLKTIFEHSLRSRKVSEAMMWQQIFFFSKSVMFHDRLPRYTYTVFVTLLLRSLTNELNDPIREKYFYMK